MMRIAALLLSPFLCCAEICGWNSRSSSSVGSSNRAFQSGRWSCNTALSCSLLCWEQLCVWRVCERWWDDQCLYFCSCAQSSKFLVGSHLSPFIFLIDLVMIWADEILVLGSFVLFRAGGWKTAYSVNIRQRTSTAVRGSMKLNVHYFEDGNVQLNTSFDREMNVAISDVCLSEHAHCRFMSSQWCVCFRLCSLSASLFALAVGSWCLRQEYCRCDWEAGMWLA